VTTYPLCVVDQRPVHTAGNLCPACWADLEHDLTEVVASLADDLDITLAGFGRSGGSPIGIVVRSASRGVGFDERAGDLARQLHNCLGGWVRVVYEDEIQPGVPLTVADKTNCLAAWLGIHEREVRRHEAVGELWHEIRDLVAQARRVVDRRPDRCYLGVCSAELGMLDGGGDAHPGFPPQPVYCDADLYSIDGHSTVDCRQCGTRHHVEHRRATLLDAVDDQLGTAAEIARALSAYANVELKVERLRQWYSRGKIAQYAPRDGDRWPRYRVGDVRELLNPTRKAS
jgi:hypothetical protein